MNPDWNLETWGFDGDLRTGVPVVSFRNEGVDLVVTVTFERTGALRSVCFSGGGVSTAGLPHVAKLTSDGQQRVSDWVLAYSLCRPPGVRKREAEMRQLRADLGEWAEHVDTGEPWELDDIVQGFAPPARPGRAAHSLVFLAGRAKEYVTRCVLGGEKVGAVARSLGIEQSTFSTQLAAARRRGLLGGAPGKGEVTGELTSEAERVLAEAARTTGGKN